MFLDTLDYKMVKEFVCPSPLLGPAFFGNIRLDYNITNNLNFFLGGPLVPDRNTWVFEYLSPTQNQMTFSLTAKSIDDTLI